MTNWTTSDITVFVTNIVGEFTKALADNAGVIVILLIATMLIGGVMGLFAYLKGRR